VSRYSIVIEKTATGFSAFSPDLPGCVATGKTRAEVGLEMRSAIQFHLEGLEAAGERIPSARTYVGYCEVPAKRRRSPYSSITRLREPNAHYKAAGSGNMAEKRIYIERREQGDYAVRRGESKRASAIEPTQKKAIERAREIEPRSRPHVERIRHTDKGQPDHWRKA
jgi:predicted RNase H-like HicB family nuclease